MSVNQPTVDFLDTETPNQEKNEAIQKDFQEISDKIKNNPDAINKITEHTLNNVESYLATNKDKSTEMLFNISESLKNPALGNRDKTSLKKLEEICLKSTSTEQVGEYQMKKEIFTTDFDFAKLKSYGILFQKGSTNDWFKNIPETYTKNEKIEAICAGKYFSPEQLTAWLYTKNKERRETISTAFDTLDITNLPLFDITKDISEIISSIKDGAANTLWANILAEISKTTSIDGYREYQDFMWWAQNKYITKREEQLNAWKKTLAEAKNSEEIKTKIDEVNTFKMDWTKVNDPVLETWNTTESANNKFTDVVTSIKNNLIKDTSNEKLNTAFTLLKEWKLKDFQTEIGITGTRKDWSSRVDWKFGKETLTKVMELTNSTNTTDKTPATEKITNLWENVTLTEDEIIHYDTNPEYSIKLEKLFTSRKDKTITLDDYQWTIKNIDWHLIIAMQWWISVSIPIKEISQDKITLNWQGEGPDRIIYNHWTYVNNESISGDTKVTNEPEITDEEVVSSTENTTNIPQWEQVNTAAGVDLSADKNKNMDKKNIIDWNNLDLITEEEYTHFDQNRPQYEKKIEQVGTNWIGKKVKVDTYEGTVENIDGQMKIKISDNESVNFTMKEASKDHLSILRWVPQLTWQIDNHNDWLLFAHLEWTNKTNSISTELPTEKITEIKQIDSIKTLTFWEKFNETGLNQDILQSYYSWYQKEFNLMVDTYNWLKQDLFQDKDTKELDTFLIKLLQEKNKQIVDLETVAKDWLKQWQTMTFTWWVYTTYEDLLKNQFVSEILTEAQNKKVITRDETMEYTRKKMFEEISKM